MPKFEVSRADDQGIQDGTKSQEPMAGEKEPDGHAAEPEEVALTMQDSHENAKRNLFLYEEDMKSMPRVSTFLKGVLSYHTTLPTEKEVETSKQQAKKAKLGVVLGVYLPTIQHIFGVLMFVRLAWIVGCMGSIQAFAMVFMCCLTTFLTSISMSAIATNGMVQAGGSYFMISRNLGPECGGAVGICFYLANTFAVDLYILGAIEILLQYIAPGLSYFGDIHHNPWNNFRVYGTVTVILLSILVAVGVKFVQMFAPFSLACVIVSILCIFIGGFIANEDNTNVWICLLGERLMALPDNMTLFTGDSWCTKNHTGDLYHRYCDQYENTTSCSFFKENDVQYIPGIPGIASGIAKDNLWSYYMKGGEVTQGVRGNKHYEVVQDMSSDFVHLCAIYFPSVTGIMTGSNMSGDLKDPQKSIPIGTILAQLTCSFVYLSFVLLFGSTAEGPLLRDKFGISQGGELLASNLAWPSHWVVLIGAFCSTLGAALQCLTSAPRLLQAIARDNIIPFLDVFRVTTANGEPIRALIITAVIAEIGIIVASLDYVAPVIDVFFLMCYAVVNVTCAMLTLMKSPSWRPRFKYYHWSLSVLGVVLNLTLSIMAGWYYALTAFLIAAFIYKYIEFKGSEKEWGDGISGLSMAAAQKALLALEEGDPHTKNWRPQLLVLAKLTKELQPKYRRVFSLASQLKAGKGLTIVAGVMEGVYSERAAESSELKQTLHNVMEEEKVKGFSKVMVTPNITEGINIFVQTVGLGGLNHNTVLVGWPYGWRQSHHERSWKVFLDTVRAVTAKELALIVPRNINNFPHNKERLSGTIDVWWIVHDGGMLILLSFLLKQHKVWKNCKMRIFTVAQITDNSIQLKKDLQTFLYQLRIDAEVYVEEMYDNDISAYTVERTLDMEKRQQMMAELRMTKRRHTIQEIVDASHNTSRHDVTRDVTPPRGMTPPKLTVSVEENSAKYDASKPSDASSDHEKEESGLLSDDSSSKKGESSSDKNGMFFIGSDKSKDDKSKDDKESGGQAMESLGVPLTEAQAAAQARAGTDVEDDKMVHFTFSRCDGQNMLNQAKQPVSVAEGKLMRMHTAVRLNESIKQHSKDAELVIINFPGPPAKLSAEENYMEYLEALTEGLDRVLMVRGSGKEVVTIYS